MSIIKTLQRPILTRNNKVCSTHYTSWQ